MKKIYIIISAVLVLFVTLNFLYFSNILIPLKKYLPHEFKNFLTKTIFYVPSLIKQKDAMYKKYDLEYKKNRILEKKLDEIQEAKGIINEEVFPQTQFTKLNYISHNVDKIEKKNFYYGTDKFVSSFYLEVFQENLILTSKKGKFFYFSINELQANQVKQIKINSNLIKEIEITDTLVLNDKIYISLHKKDKDCNNFSIYEAKINLDFLRFENFFTIDSGDGKCDRDTVAGRIAYYQNGDKKGLLATVFNAHNIIDMTDQFNLIKEFKFSSLVFIDFQNKKEKLIAAGFRNPQGLIVLKDEYILTSEHGPRGGDELNKIFSGKNYGWPEVSYGEKYNENYLETDNYRYKKSHEDFGFEEPIFSFVPSIAPSQMIELDNKFSAKWQNNILLTSLKSKSLFRLTFNKDYSNLITYEKITVGKRIRDIAYSKKFRLIFLAEEDNQGSIGILSVN